MARRSRKWRPAIVLRRAFFFVLGSLLVGFLAVLFQQSLGVYLPRHFAVSLAVGFAVAATFWLLGLLKHPPLFLKNASSRGGILRGPGSPHRAVLAAVSAAPAIIVTTH
ncbi:MAG: hypothetical protein IPH30_17960 [Betaproteobacteria bacterium]|nr:hypothetical protein [Betaproteobacteria bacterium]